MTKKPSSLLEIWGGTSEEGAAHLQMMAAQFENFGK